MGGRKRGDVSVRYASGDGETCSDCPWNARSLGVLLLVNGCFDSQEETQVAEGWGAFSDLLWFVTDEAAYRERETISDYAAIREHYGWSGPMVRT